jgi:serine phosphatase RsbU (regulator of sigma subunit)
MLKYAEPGLDAGDDTLVDRPRIRPVRVDEIRESQTAQDLVRDLDHVQQEVNSLRAELNVLRRRDETLNFYMHRLDEELRLAARLQQDFLPKTLPQLGAVHFHTLFRPAGYVSGDLYDIIRLDERRIGFYIADAVGHGMPAALLTMFIKHALVTKEIQGNSYRLLSPAESLTRLNVELIEQNLSQAAFATAVYGIIDVQSMEVTISRAGHPSPLILRAGGAIETIECEGPLLGIFPDEKFAIATAKLAQGDRLFLYTDGIEVAFSDHETVDSERWKEELFSRRSCVTEELLNVFADRIDNEAGSLAPKDDLTIVVLEVKS